MFGFLSGLLVANAGEWYIHKYWLHGLGKKKDSFWRFHWAIHHKTVMQEEYRDSDYEKPWWTSWNPQSKEVATLVGGAAVFTPLLPIFPGFVAGIWFSQWNYFRVHKKSHLNPEWGYKYLPWHYDHHMGQDQDKNWCVTFPLWDYVMGTRVPYKGTEREKKDLERKQRKMEIRQTKTSPIKTNDILAEMKPSVN